MNTTWHLCQLNITCECLDLKVTTFSFMSQLKLISSCESCIDIQFSESERIFMNLRAKEKKNYDSYDSILFCFSVNVVLLKWSHKKLIIFAISVVNFFIKKRNKNTKIIFNTFSGAFLILKYFTKRT